MGAEVLLEIFTALVGAVAIVGFLATVAEAIVEGFVAPIFDRYEKLTPHKFWLFYVAWAVSGVLVFLSGVNLFEQFIPAYGTVGQVLTAIIAGRGSNFLHDLFSARRKQAQVNASLVRSESCDEEVYKMLLATDWREIRIAGGEETPVVSVEE